MRDNLRRYRAIHDTLRQCSPGEPTGNFARHVGTLAAFINGIIASRSSQLPHIATKVPDGTKPESRVKRYARWVSHDAISTELYFLPHAELLLACFA